MNRRPAKRHLACAFVCTFVCTFACTADDERPAAPSPREDPPKAKIERAAGASANASSSAPDPAPPTAPAASSAPSTLAPELAPELTPELAPELAPAPNPTPIQDAPKPASTGVTRATTRLLKRLAPDLARATDGLTFELSDNDRVWVTDGKRRAQMRVHADAILDTTPVTSADGTAQIELTYSDETRCDGPLFRRAYSRDSLLARLENSTAFKDHRRSDHAAAARGFAIAAQLDPIPDKRWTNLACALALSGQIDQAIVAFGPMLRRNPVRAYATILSDHELSSLRERPEVKALRAKTPGTAALSLQHRQLQSFTIAYSRHLGMIAGVHRADDGGSCEFKVGLTIYDVHSGARVTTVELIRSGDTMPECGDDADGAGPSLDPRHVREVQAKLDHANTLLRDLGFTVSADLERVVLTHGEAQVRFAKAGLELELGDDDARLRDSDRTVELGAIQGLGYTMLTRAGYDPIAKVAFLEWLNDLPEGCASDLEGAGFRLIPTATSKSATR